jgi:hypothetical protein
MILATLSNATTQAWETRRQPTYDIAATNAGMTLPAVSHSARQNPSAEMVCIAIVSYLRRMSKAACS